jgi:hypothetical protein
VFETEFDSLSHVLGSNQDSKWDCNLSLERDASASKLLPLGILCARSGAIFLIAPGRNLSSKFGIEP